MSPPGARWPVSWQKSARYRIGSWLVGLGQDLLRAAERREIASRVAVRLRREPKGAGYDRRAKDIAADEITKFYVAKQKATEGAE